MQISLRIIDLGIDTHITNRDQPRLRFSGRIPDSIKIKEMDLLDWG